ncbi:MAG: acyloxyacyl hydrolase [Chlorobiaceae bacterium]
MKKLLLTILGASLCATPVSAAISPYFSGSVGVGLLGNSDETLSDGRKITNAITYKTGIPFVGAVGLKVDALRGEVALGYQMNSVDKLYGKSLSELNAKSQHITSFSYMANGYYDVTLNNSNFSPYVTAGLGGDTVRLTDNGFNTVLVWQAGAGLGFKMTKHMTLDLGYRYFKPSAIKLYDGTITASYNQFLLGLRLGL